MSKLTVTVNRMFIYKPVSFISKLLRLRRAQALIELSPKLPPRERKVAIREAFAAGVSCVQDHERAWAIAHLVPFLPAD